MKITATLSLVLLASCLWMEGKSRPTPEPFAFFELGPAPVREHAAWTSSLAEAPAAGIFSVDLGNREESRDFYNVVYTASEGFDMEWTGNYDSGVAGTVGADFKEAVRLRVNFYRAMAGVPANVTFEPAYESALQDTAMMMSANNKLSHYPEISWALYTEQGADAASKSNIALGSSGPDAITGYMEDYGANNDRVGHRRWVLYPNNSIMATGDVPGNGALKEANALWVIPTVSSERPETREEFVAWPAPGYMPYPLTFARWSFSYPDASFENATVTMTRGDENIAVKMEPVSSANVGDPTVVWQANNLNANVFPPERWPKPSEDETISVQVNNVLINGKNENFQYDVIIYDPDNPAIGAPKTTFVGSSNPVIGQANEYAVSSKGYGEGIQWRIINSASVSWTEGAENGLERFVAQVSDYDPIMSGRIASGSKAFHLATPGSEPQRLTLVGEFIPLANASLNFKSSLAWATQTQVARVELSVNSGDTWISVWELTGPVTSNSFFTNESVSLANWEGKTISLRFVYSASGSLYPQTDTSVGWAIDDIQLINAESVESVVLSQPSENYTFYFVPQSTEPVFLQVREKAFGSFYLDWSDLKIVTPANGPSRDGPVLVSSEWTFDDVIGWNYGVTSEWGYSVYMGWTNYTYYPWIFNVTHQWFYYSKGTSATGLWLYSPKFGNLIVNESSGGWFQYEPYTAQSWANFFIP